MSSGFDHLQQLLGHRVLVLDPALYGSEDKNASPVGLNVRSVGLELVRLAAARGAQVLAITSGSKGDAVLTNGAAHAFNRDSLDIHARINAAALSGLDVVADIAGGPGLSAMMPMLADNGRWVIAGAVA